VVVIPVKRGPVPVHPVPLVPLLVLGEGMVHGRAVPLLPGHAQRGFDHRAEHQPVGERRSDAARRLERADHIALRLTIESLPQLARRAHDRVREERRVDERLSAAGEVQKVGRARVGRGAEAAPTTASRSAPGHPPSPAATPAAPAPCLPPAAAPPPPPPPPLPTRPPTAPRERGPPACGPTSVRSC